MTIDLPPSLQFAPYFAGLENKSEEETSAIEDRIDQLPEPVRAFLFDDALADALEAAARRAGLPDQYAIATAKIVFMAILGDIPLTATGQLLEKLGVAPATAASLAGEIDGILKPVISARGAGVAREGMRPMKPLTEKIETPPAQKPANPQVPAKNVVDLRKTPNA